MTNTTNYGLKKPDSTDKAKILDINENMDTIDAVLKGIDAKFQYYGTCATAAATSAKVVTCSEFLLATGAEIEILFTYGNTASSPTLNINSTGAKSVTGAWSDGQLVRARYDGANYVIVTATVSGLWTKIRDIPDVIGTTQTVSIALSDISFLTHKKIKLTGKLSHTSPPTNYNLTTRINNLSAGYDLMYIYSGGGAYVYTTTNSGDMVNGVLYSGYHCLVDIEISQLDNYVYYKYEILNTGSYYSINAYGRISQASLSSLDFTNQTSGKYPILSGFSLWGMK